MKCVSLWQPWASLIALGHKRIETRSWETGYRGRLAIHAAKRPICADGVDLLTELALDIHWGMGLPIGAVVATCDLVACLPTPRVRPGHFEPFELFDPRRLAGADPSVVTVTPRERRCGDYSPGRWAWVVENVVCLVPPVPWRGRQRIFDLPDKALKAVPA